MDYEKVCNAALKDKEVSLRMGQFSLDDEVTWDVFSSDPPLTLIIAIAEIEGLAELKPAFLAEWMFCTWAI